jgi:hypothetical protein
VKARLSSAVIALRSTGAVCCCAAAATGKANAKAAKTMRVAVVEAVHLPNAKEIFVIGLKTM